MARSGTAALSWLLPEYCVGMHVCLTEHQGMQHVGWLPFGCNDHTSYTQWWTQRPIYVGWGMTCCHSLTHTKRSILQRVLFATSSKHGGPPLVVLVRVHSGDPLSYHVTVMASLENIVTTT